MNDLARRQSPIFSKTSDYLLWLLQHTEKFPKSERFRMARRLEETAFEFYELLVKAARTKQDSRQILVEADLELEKLRLYTRLAQARKLTSIRQYQYAAGQMMEIGRLLGGWIKSLS